MLGQNHPDTLASVNNLAGCYESSGDATRALSLYEGVLAGHRRMIGNRNPRTLHCIHNLADCCRKSGKPRRAQQLFEQALRGRKRQLGETHPDSLASLCELAACVQDLGDLRRARCMHEEALNGRRRTLGEDHPDTLWSLRYLALLCNEIDDSEGVAVHGSAFLASVASTTARDGDWPGHASRALDLLSTMIEAGDARPDWPEQVLAISRAFIEDLDLADVEVRESLLEPFSQVHARWLSLCIEHDPGSIPLTLGALQAREMASLLLRELQLDEAQFSDGDPRRRYLETLRELSLLRLRLKSVTAHDASGLIEDRKLSMSGEENRRQWKRLKAKHNEIYARYRSLAQDVAELDLLAKEWDLQLASWQIGTRSLLNRDALGNYKFAHRSIMEFLFVKRLWREDEATFDVPLTDQSTRGRDAGH